MVEGTRKRMILENKKQKEKLFLAETLIECIFLLSYDYYFKQSLHRKQMPNPKKCNNVNHIYLFSRHMIQYNILFRHMFYSNI